jgi:hypothetical protein
MIKTNNIKEILAQTFTPQYDEIEDRIRLVVNYQDIENRVDFMITRNFILNLIPTIDEFILNHYSNNLHDEALFTTSNFEKNGENNLSQTDNSNLELLKTEDQLLVKVNLSYDQNSKNTVLSLYSKNHIIAKASVDSNMLQQILKVIKKSIPNFRWGISQHF